MITVVNSDNWVGIYMDGKLLSQGHSFSESEVLGIVGLDVESVWVDPTSCLSSFPDDLDNLEDEGWVLT